MLVTACKFCDLKVTGEDKAIRDLNPIKAQSRSVQAIYLLGKTGDFGWRVACLDLSLSCR